MVSEDRSGPVRIPRAEGSERCGRPRRGPVPTFTRAISAAVVGLATFGFPGFAAATERDGPPLQALVLEHRDDATGGTGLADGLERAGFSVEPLDRDAVLSPEIALVAIGSFASEHPGYDRLVVRRRDALAAWIAKGGVALEMTQNDGIEPAVRWLPDGMSAERGDHDFLSVSTRSRVPTLLEGLTEPTHGFPVVRLRGHPRRVSSWDTFDAAIGFEAVAWCDEQLPRELPAVLVGRQGSGRVVLTSLYLDKTDGPDGDASSTDWRSASGRFFENVARFVRAVRDGSAEEPDLAPRPVAAPLARVPGSWTLAVLPDTQMYTAGRPEPLVAQTEWIARNRRALDIRLVVHEGDVVNRDEPKQWRVARRAFDRLRGTVPFTLSTGNHDYRPDETLAGRDTGLTRFFPAGAFERMDGFGETYEPGRIENSAWTIDTDDRGFVVLTLEWMPRDAVVAWADDVLTRYADRSAIVVTHAYLGADDRRIRAFPAHGSVDAHPPAALGDHDGESLWRALVSRHANVVLVLSGHVTGDGAGRLTSRGRHGNPVHQILANYQQRIDGGQGYLRLLEFPPDGRDVRVRTYSPWLDRFMTTPEHQFVLPLPPPPPPAPRAGDAAQAPRGPSTSGRVRSSGSPSRHTMSSSILTPPYGVRRSTRPQSTASASGPSRNGSSSIGMK